MDGIAVRDVKVVDEPVTTARDSKVADETAGALGDIKVVDITATTIAEVKVVECYFKVHTFHDKILDSNVFFQVIKMLESFYLWVGKTNRFGELSVGMTMPGKMPSSTILIGGHASHSVAMAERLSKRTGKQVFIAGDFSCFNQLEIPLVEQRIAEELKYAPDIF